MRVLLDANIWISYLLSPSASGPIGTIIASGFAGRFTFLLPEHLLQEFVARIETKPYLAARIEQEELHRFAGHLRAVGELIPEITAPIPAVTRDPKDDYLLAYAVVGQADYLVSGDADLLVLNRVGKLIICRPRDFLTFLHYR